VVTVSVEVPLPPATDAELKPQVGGTAVTGVMAQVRATAELKPPDGVTVTVDVDGLPAAIDAGVSAVAVTAKLGVGAAATFRLTVAVCVRFPAVPVTVMLL